MDPSKRNAAALHQRIDDLADTLSATYSSLFSAAQKDDGGASLAEIAHTELRIREESHSLVRAARDISGLIRDLQELWLGGRLDTICEGGGGEEGERERERVVGVARMVEGLVKGGRVDGASGV